MWVDIYSATDHNQAGRRADSQYHGGADRAGSTRPGRDHSRCRRWMNGAAWCRRGAGLIRGVVHNMIADLGSFVIDLMETSLDTPGAPELTVSGDDILRELAAHRGRDGGIYEDDLRTPSFWRRTETNLATVVSDNDVEIGGRDANRIWERTSILPARISSISCVCFSKKSNRAKSTLTVQYNRRRVIHDQR